MKIDRKKFFQILEENFCKKCEYYIDNGDHLWEHGTCCKIESFDKCIIFYLTGVDEFDEEF